MKQGEIYKLKREFRAYYSPKCYKHPFIYWKEKHADYTGIMLTTSENPEYKNIELKEEYFLEDYIIGFGKSELNPKSYVAPLYLLKDVKYEHLELVGELSDEGKAFIKSIVGGLEYTDWKSHMNIE
jgi:hypothetical protein